MKKIFTLPYVRFPENLDIQRIFNSLIDAIYEGGRKLEQVESLDSIRITGVTLPATTNTAVNHKLGRQIIGWKVTDRDAAATIHRIDWDDKTITLYASAEVTIDLEVF